MPNQEIDKGRRDILKAAVAGGIALGLAGCGATPESKASPTPNSPEPTQVPSETPPPLSEILSSPTPKPPEPTPDLRPTISPEAIPYPQVEITADLLKQGFYAIGDGNRDQTVDLSKVATPTPTETKIVSWGTIEGYTSAAWDEKIELPELSQDEIKAAQAIIALVAQAGVEGFGRPGELAQLEGMALPRLAIDRLPGNVDFYETKVNGVPTDMMVRKGTHLTVLGVVGDEAVVAFDESIKREGSGITPRDVPRQYFTVMPVKGGGISLENLISAAPGWTCSNGVIEHIDEQGKVHHQELNVVEQSLAEKIKRKAGAMFVDSKANGDWYENPIVPYPPAESQSTHIVASGETLSKIAEQYNVNVQEVLANNPEITDASSIVVGQEIKIKVPGYTDYMGPLKSGNRIVILTSDQTRELAEAIYNEQTKQWEWKAIAVAEPTVAPTAGPTKLEPTTPSETGSNIQSSLPDFRETQQVSSVEMEINGEKREFLGWRIGFTEVYVDKEFVSLDADFVLGGHKNSGETILPNLGEQLAGENIAKLGAFVHAINLGLIQRSNTQIPSGWFEQFTQYLKDNPGISYEMEAYLPIEGKEGTYGETKLGEINPSLPVKFVILPPRMDHDEAWERADRIKGSDDRAPFHLAYVEPNSGYYEVLIDGNKQLSSFYSSFTTNGKLYGDRSFDCYSEIYGLIEISSLPSGYRSVSTSFAPSADTSIYKPLSREMFADPGQWQRPYLMWAQP